MGIFCRFWSDWRRCDRGIFGQLCESAEIHRSAGTRIHSIKPQNKHLRIFFSKKNIRRTACEWAAAVHYRRTTIVGGRMRWVRATQRIPEIRELDLCRMLTQISVARTPSLRTSRKAQWCFGNSLEVRADVARQTHEDHKRFESDKKTHKNYTTPTNCRSSGFWVPASSILQYPSEWLNVFNK